tara:strand:- start:1973 stop:3382 length:1410 start_codon:yes stop_codon:yes gene_type:complete
MIVNNLEDVDLSDVPVVIIGSGPAAITLALELEKKKISSIIIEAGDEKYNYESQQSYKAEVIGDKISNFTHNRLRQFGGTSGHWGGWCKPLADYNFANWNINKKDLDIYSNETCKILGINNEFRSIELNNNFEQIEFQYSKVRFARKFRSQIKNSNYIKLILKTQVSHFEGNDNFTQYAVCYSKQKKYEIKSKLFILACGGIENSRILLWTKEKNDGFINNYLPIGKYWMCHPWMLGGVGVIKKKKFKKILKEEYIEYEGPVHIATTKNIRKEKNILGGALYMNAVEDTKIYKEIIKDLLCVAPELGKKIARKVFSKDLKCGNIFLQIEEEPKITNKITLHPNLKDSLDIPITKLFYFQSKSSLLNAKTILENFGDFCRKTDSGRIAIKEEIENLQNYESLGVNHHIGGTRMGNSSKTSVVDENLKLHDNKNLYVLGSSNFVSSGYANPTYTIIQMSLRLANEISNKLL